MQSVGKSQPQQVGGGSMPPEYMCSNVLVKSAKPVEGGLGKSYSAMVVWPEDSTSHGCLLTGRHENAAALS